MGFKCPYDSQERSLSECPKGFPGCGCGDDILEEEGPGWEEWKRSGEE
jgi:hypothetical protein